MYYHTARHAAADALCWRVRLRWPRTPELRGIWHPPFAALSHRLNDDELTFEGIGQRAGTAKLGYAKAKGAMLEARSNNFEHIWVDICCIDKSSSAELSEAINSMWAWYQNSSACYVYLADVSTTIESSLSDFDAEFCKSECFTRGWTLQELVAPREVVFYNKEWIRSE